MSIEDETIVEEIRNAEHAEEPQHALVKFARALARHAAEQDFAAAIKSAETHTTNNNRRRAHARRRGK